MNKRIRATIHNVSAYCKGFHRITKAMISPSLQWPGTAHQMALLIFRYVLRRFVQRVRMRILIASYGLLSFPVCTPHCRCILRYTIISRSTAPSERICGSFVAFLGPSLDSAQRKALVDMKSAAATGGSRRSAERVQSLFDTIGADVYDTFNDAFSFGLHRQWKKQLAKRSMPRDHSQRFRQSVHALDVCCGTGDVAFALARQLEVYGIANGRVVGIDFAEHLLDQARSRSQSFTARNTLELMFQTADATSLPFDDLEFDCATVGYGLRNVADKDAMMAELARVLKANCRVAILDFNSPDEGECNAPLMVQRGVLNNAVVPAASLVGLEDEYEYLYPSIASFESGYEQEVLALRNGFSQAQHTPIAGGLMGILVAVK